MVSDTTVLGKRKRVKQSQPQPLKTQKSQKQPKPAAKEDQAKKAAEAEAAAAERAALEEAQAIFRRHFEAQFVPLQGSEKDAGGPAGRKGRKEKAGEEKSGADDDDDDDDDDGRPGVEDLRSDSEDGDDWDGLSEEEDDDDDDSDDAASEGDSEEAETSHKVEVVDHSKPPAGVLTPQALTGMTKREKRAYLSSRPPDALTEAETSKARQELLLKQKDNAGPGPEDAQNEDSKALLANDLELQRLISESHILSSANPFNTTTSGAARLAFAGGKARAAQTDMRLRALGGKGSIFTQQSMPMGMRKGITGAKAAREERRRREARENGIILERPAAAAGGDGGGGGGKKKKKSTFGRRDLPVDMPGMGRMKGGELRLNKRDVKAVENEGKRFDGKRKKKRR